MLLIDIKPDVPILTIQLNALHLTGVDVQLGPLLVLRQLADQDIEMVESLPSFLVQDPTVPGILRPLPAAKQQ